jgi:hypothetical protein
VNLYSKVRVIEIQETVQRPGKASSRRKHWSRNWNEVRKLGI